MNTRKKLIILFSFIGLGVCFLVTTLARYSSSSVWNYYLESHGFYFSSDSLGSDKRNVNTLWDGNSVHFNLKNNSNNNLITDYDIRYTVTCEVLSDIPVVCKLNGTQNSSVNGVLSHNARCVNNVDQVDVSSLTKTECELGGYDWQVLAVNQDLYFDLEATEDYDIQNVEVEITVSSTSPYRKSINGTFSLFKNTPDAGSITKTINDGVDSDELVLTNSYDTRKCLNVTFDSTKRIVDVTNDMSNTDVDANGYVNEFEISIDSKSNKKIKFFNKDFSSNYTVDDFVVTEIGCQVVAKVFGL